MGACGECPILKPIDDVPVRRCVYANTAKIYNHKPGSASTYDHRILRILLPVCSAYIKRDTGGLVVRWVTTGESPLLYVFDYFVTCGTDFFFDLTVSYVNPKQTLLTLPAGIQKRIFDSFTCPSDDRRENIYRCKSHLVDRVSVTAITMGHSVLVQESICGQNINNNAMHQFRELRKFRKVLVCW
jgi:hypothetical protein